MMRLKSTARLERDQTNSKGPKERLAPFGSDNTIHPRFQALDVRARIYSSSMCAAKPEIFNDPMNSKQPLRTRRISYEEKPKENVHIEERVEFSRKEPISDTTAPNEMLTPS